MIITCIILNLGKKSSLQNKDDKTIPLLKSFLYSEHYATQLCKNNNIETTSAYVCEKCGEDTGDRVLTLNEMIFKLFSKIHHRLIHDISPNTEKIISWIGQFKPLANDSIKELFKQTNAWLRFYLNLISAIANLYSKINGSSTHLSAIEYNKPINSWIFYFE